MPNVILTELRYNTYDFIAVVYEKFNPWVISTSYVGKRDKISLFTNEDLYTAEEYHGSISLPSLFSYLA